MTNKHLKVAIIGVGFIGKQHIEAIHRIPNTSVVALVEPSIEQAAKIASEYGIEHYYDSMTKMMNDIEVDVVHICTPNFLHYPMAKEALESGLHVFCEKPLSLTASESKELAELAKSTGLKAAVNHNYRANAMVREMRHRVVNGAIGKPLMVVGQYIQDWLMFEDDYDWHFDPEKVGPSRSVADIGSHLFDLIQFVMNENITRLYAELITVYPTRKKREQFGETFALEYGDEVSEVEVKNEDGAFIIAELESGVKVSMTISQVTGGYKNGVELIVSGSKNSLTWNQEQADHLIIGKRNEGNELLYADQKYLDPSLKRFISLPNGHSVGWADAFKNSIAEFYLDLRDQAIEENSYVSFEAGHRLMRLVEASLLSSKEKRWVEIDI